MGVFAAIELGSVGPAQGAESVATMPATSETQLQAEATAAPTPEQPAGVDYGGEAVGVPAAEGGEPLEETPAEEPVDGSATEELQVPVDDGPTGAEEVEPTLAALVAQSLKVDMRGEIVDANGSGVIDAGDEIHYEFEVKNGAGVPVTGLVVTTTHMGGVTCAETTSLDPQDGTVCTANMPYVITAADINSGAVIHAATATAQAPCPVIGGGNNRVVALAGETCPVFGEDTETTVLPSLGLDKQVADVEDVNDDGIVDTGDRIDYQFVVTNTGDVTVTDVAVSDPMLGGVSCPVTTLEPGQSTICLGDGPYAVTADDAEAGAVVNVATAMARGSSCEDGTGPQGGGHARSARVVADTCAVESVDSTTTQVGLPSSPGLAMDKRLARSVDVNSNGRVDAGDELYYEFKLTNTGNELLTGLTVDDGLLAGAGISVSCAADTLAPGAAVLCEADAAYLVTAEDESAGAVVNVAGAIATDAGGDQVRSNRDAVTTGVDAAHGVIPNAGGPGLALALLGLMLLGIGAALVRGTAETRTRG